jgi:hypothetical protein
MKTVNKKEAVRNKSETAIWRDSKWFHHTKPRERNRREHDVQNLNTQEDMS